MLPRYRQWLLNKGIKQRLGSCMVIRFLHCASSVYKNPTLPPSVESHNSLLFLYNGITGEFGENVFGFHCGAGKHRENLAIWSFTCLEVHIYLFPETA